MAILNLIDLTEIEMLVEYLYLLVEYLVFIREDLQTKLIGSQMKIEGFFIELNLRRKKSGFCTVLIILNIFKLRII